MAKFRPNCQAVLGPHVDEVLSLLWDLDGLDDVRAVGVALSGAARA